MKRVTFILTFVAMFIWNNARGQFSLGIKGSVAKNDVFTEVYIDAVNQAPKGLTTFNYGITGEYNFQPRLSIMAEATKSQKGFTIDESTSFQLGGIKIPIGGRVSTSLNYIETAILFKANIGNPNAQMYGIVGPSLGYATSGRLQPTATLLIDINLPTVNIDLDNTIYSRWEASTVVGVGGQMNTEHGKLFADIRYQLGLTDIINDSTIDLKLKNRAMLFSAGYAHTF